MKSLFWCLLLLSFSAPTLAGIELQGAFTQGGLLRGRVALGSRVYAGKRQLRVNSEGYFWLGFGRNAVTDQTLTMIAPSGRVSFKKLLIRQRHYRIQRIDGIRKKMMSPTPRELQRIKREADQIAQARQHDSDLENFRASFIWPVQGRISGVYGSQRILNGEPRRPHCGIDIVAPIGRAVIAPAGGIVRLAHPGMFFSGKTLIIDHGFGLSSTFLHLSKILVKKGQRVKQGETIARVGASGRVTGPHLDWRINWFQKRLDPALLVPPMMQ